MADRADIVIGANFGDEGKGLVTDYLAAHAGFDTIVVRHNGGAQAGHTVTTPDGKRHVFKHFGSGTLAGAKTYLSRFYACNPILFFQELEKLEKLGSNPIVFADPSAPISTPYDMMINQIIEEHRGSSRHGSCGVGFGETIERTQYPEYVLFLRDLKDRRKLRDQLQKIRGEWLPARLSMLGIRKLSPEWQARVYSTGVFDWYMDQARCFMKRVVTASPSILSQSGSVIFEGAQGLLLDQDYGWFPHVTRSNTGIQNALEIAKDAGIDEIRAVYITRAYNTRHGAGPLQHELPEKPYPGIHDATNIHNEFQGGLRFAHLDLDLLSATIRYDLRHAHGLNHFSHTIAISCVDQVGPAVSYIHDGRKVTADPDFFVNTVMNAVGVEYGYVSHGPTREHIELRACMPHQNMLAHTFKHNITMGGRI